MSRISRIYRNRNRQKWKNRPKIWFQLLHRVKVFTFCSSGEQHGVKVSGLLQSEVPGYGVTDGGAMPALNGRPSIAIEITPSLISRRRYPRTAVQHHSPSPLQSEAGSCTFATCWRALGLAIFMYGQDARFKEGQITSFPSPDH